jgi:hypothetical protein
LVIAARRRVAVTSALAPLAALLLVALAAAAPTTKFVSKHYGYSIVLPGSSSDWSPHFASHTWSGDVIPEQTDWSLDNFTGLRPGEGVFLIAAQRPPAGTTLEKWTDFVISARQPGCEAPHSTPVTSTLDGTPALVTAWLCPGESWVIVISALHAGRGYFMLLFTQTNVSHASDQRLFDAGRDSFRFLSGK